MFFYDSTIGDIHVCVFFMLYPTKEIVLFRIVYYTKGYKNIFSDK